MESTARAFNENVDHALADPNLQDSLAMLKVGFSERRRQAAERHASDDGDQHRQAAQLEGHRKAAGDQLGNRAIPILK